MKKNFAISFIFSILFLSFASISHAQSSLITHFGMLGDSITDEYRANDNRGGTYANRTYNWLEMLVMKRGFNVGAWGTRSEPRRSGYEYNFARSGATAASMINSGQHTGLAPYVQNGQVQLVFIMIGSNDFGWWNTSDGFAPIYNGTLSGSALQNKINNIVTNITTAVNTIKAAGNAKIMLSTIGDASLSPVAQSQYPDPVKRARVTNAIAQVNTALTTMAQSKGIAMFNLDSIADDILPLIDPVTGTGTYWGETITFAPGDEPHHLQLGDGIHSGTIAGGVIANRLLGGFNANFQTNVPPLSEAEILSIAGITPKYADGCGLDGFDTNKHLNVLDIGYYITQPSPINSIISLLRNWQRWCP